MHRQTCGAETGFSLELEIAFSALVTDMLSVYWYAPHNDVSVNDVPHIRQWSREIIIL